MKKILIYFSAFFLGVISISVGFYLFPFYKLSLVHNNILGPLSVFLFYFIFSLPPVTIYLKWLLRISWTKAITRGGIMFLFIFMAMAIVGSIFMHPLWGK